MITIDGSAGGGQMLRYALSLAALSSQPTKITNIRANRPRPGLNAQHFACIEVFRQLGHKVTDAHLGATEITIYPGSLKKKSVKYDIGTAGSITLVLQSLLLPCCFADGPVRIALIGGTDVPWSHSIDFFRTIIAWYYEPYANITFKVIKRGYYPKGGGQVQCSITPKLARDRCHDYHDFIKTVRAKWKPLHLKKPKQWQSVRGKAHASSVFVQEQATEKLVRAAGMKLAAAGITSNITQEYCATASPGAGIMLRAEGNNTTQGDRSLIVGTDLLVEKGMWNETGAKVADILLKRIQGQDVLDPHTADSVLPLLALVGGSYHAAETQHITTAIEVINTFANEETKLYKIEQKEKLIQAQQA